MPRKRKTTEIELGGQDSFLDLVSNIVGVLIILVMVAGVRAQYSSANASNSLEPLADATMLADLETKYAEMHTKEAKTLQLRESIENLNMQSEIVAEQIQRQGMEYAALFDVMISARASIEIAAETKSQTFQEKIDYQRQLLETNTRLEQLERERTHYQQIRPQATVLENIPTPLSRTLKDDKEIHVRLLGGRIVYVPLLELIQQLRRNLNEGQHRYARQQTSVGKVGPIENFELEFLLVRHETHAQGINFHGEVVPQFEPMGQSLREALASPQSEFRRKLSVFRRDIYTVTVWVYPDSFEEYHELKRFLHDLGYSIAARPMNMGVPISVSPYGTRSSTQ